MLFFVSLANLVILSVLLLRKYSWRRAIISAAIIWGVFIVTTTEILSLFSSLYFPFILVCWLLFDGIVIGFYFLDKEQKKSLVNRDLLNKISFKNIQKNWFLSLLIGAITAIAIVILTIALAAPPNTWDSMTYHMSRVVNWMQNGSVAHYTTYNLPQLFHPPFAEYVIAHWQILSGGDRYANLVQWLSYLGSAIAVSLIAEELGCNLRGQIFAVVFAMTIPMGVLQASGTQNDYVISFWILCLAYFVLLARDKGNRKGIYFFIGSSLGLAIFTKSSGYLYGFAFMVWFGLLQLKRWGIKGFKFIFIPSAITLLLNLNHYLRNYQLFGSFLGTPENFATQYKMEAMSVPIFISNILRNVTLHMDIVRNLKLEGFIIPITGIINKLMLMLHQFMGLDMYDPRITASSYRSIPGLSFDENTANNPLHLAVIMLVLGYFCFNRKIQHKKLIATYILASISGFLLLCFLLKIQAYQSRHHLVAFLLLAPIVGLCLSQIKPKKIGNIIISIVLIASLPWVFNNQFRPLNNQQNVLQLSRTEQYFINRSYLQKPYENAVNFLSQQKCDRIGLSLGTGEGVGNEYWEYPLWVLLHQQNPQIVFKHLNPDNISQTVADYSDFNPCAILAIRTNKEDPVSKMQFKQHLYIAKWKEQPISILLKKLFKEYKH